MSIYSVRFIHFDFTKLLRFLRDHRSEMKIAESIKQNILCQTSPSAGMWLSFYKLNVNENILRLITLVNCELPLVCLMFILFCLKKYISEVYERDILDIYSSTPDD